MQTAKQDLDLTEWLEKVWNALDEPDETKRNQLLEAADTLLQEDRGDADAPALERIVA